MERSVTQSLIVRVDDLRASDPREDFLAVEEPLEIQLGYERRGWRVHKSVSITMRTPGADAELAAGFLFTEGIVTDAAQIEGIHAEAANVIRVELRVRRRRRSATAGTSFLHHFELRRVRQGVHRGAQRRRQAPMSVVDGPVLDAATVHGLSATLRGTQAVFDQTGGLHAAAIFDAVRPPARRPARTWADTTPWTSSSAASFSPGNVRRSRGGCCS